MNTKNKLKIKKEAPLKNQNKVSKKTQDNSKSLMYKTERTKNNAIREASSKARKSLDTAPQKPPPSQVQEEDKGLAYHLQNVQNAYK